MILYFSITPIYHEIRQSVTLVQIFYDYLKNGVCQIFGPDPLFRPLVPSKTFFD